MARQKSNVIEKTKKPQRIVQALELRIQGKTFPQIAQAMAISQSTAHSYVMDGISAYVETCQQLASHLVQVELERLDEGVRRVYQSDGFQLGEPSAINAWVRLSERRCKLLGLDAPARTDVTSNGESIKYYGPGMEDV